MRTLLGLGWMAAASAWGQPIPVVNGDFELPAQAPNGFTSGATVPGWAPASGSPGGAWGVFYPTMASWGFVAPLNHQVLYTNGPTVEQVLTTNAAAGQTYTLRVDVSNRPTYGGHLYFVELYAGATLLGRDNNTLSPPSGGYLTSTVIASVAVGSPGVGQPLKIRLGGLNQEDFDNVRLTAGGCYANCDGSTTTPVLNVLDFSCFLNHFAAGDAYANCDGSTTTPVLNVLDFSCFLNHFAAGCT